MKQYRNHKTKKHLGQNWLIDNNILHKIVEAANIIKNDTILEIGTGTGSLTNELAGLAKYVVSYEIDPDTQTTAKENLQTHNNIEFILKDILQETQTIQEVTQSESCKVVANIPYNITTPILEWLITQKNHISSITLMVQKEFGERIVAKPNTKEYSSLSIFIQYHFQVEKIWKVNRTCFKPVPRVDSLILKCTPHQTPPVEVVDENLFFQLVHTSFWGRRKTFRNTLIKHPAFRLSAEQADKLLLACEIPLLTRGETFSLLQFARITNTYHKMFSTT